MLEWLSNNGGVVLQAIVIIFTVTTVFFGMKGEIRILRHDVRSVEKTIENLSESLKQLGSILTQVAVQDSRLGMIERAIDELRHGNGYIKALER